MLQRSYYTFVLLTLLVIINLHIKLSLSCVEVVREVDKSEDGDGVKRGSEHDESSVTKGKECEPGIECNGAANRTEKARITCCVGYKEVKQDNGTTICIPECKGGCIKGQCIQPNKCICDDGYIGELCNTKCRGGKWGNNCLNNCLCLNDAVCDNINGTCHCKVGWRGENCGTPCPSGYYGKYCIEQCQCGSINKCHHINGECLMPPNRRLLVTTHNTTQRIPSTSWTKVDPPAPLSSDNHPIILHALNSIANLTENMAKLTQKFDEQSQISVVYHTNEDDGGRGGVSDGDASGVVEDGAAIAGADVSEGVLAATIPSTIKNHGLLIFDSSLYEPATAIQQKNDGVQQSTYNSFLSEFTPYMIVIFILIIIVSALLIFRIVKSIQFIRKKRMENASGRHKSQSEQFNLPIYKNVKNAPLPAIPQDKADIIDADKLQQRDKENTYTNQQSRFSNVVDNEYKIMHPVSRMMDTALQENIYDEIMYNVLQDSQKPPQPPPSRSALAFQNDTYEKPEVFNNLYGN